METKRRRTIYVSNGTWDTLHDLSKDFRTSVSGVIELMAKQLKGADSKPFAKFIEGVLIEATKILRSGKAPKT